VLQCVKKETCCEEVGLEGSGRPPSVGIAVSYIRGRWWRVEVVREARRAS